MSSPVKRMKVEEGRCCGKVKKQRDDKGTSSATLRRKNAKVSRRVDDVFATHKELIERECGLFPNSYEASPLTFEQAMLELKHHDGGDLEAERVALGLLAVIEALSSSTPSSVP